MSIVLSELELQRLVDGELNDDQQQQLLRKLDECPDEWRTVALAFVEQQVFADGSQELLADAPFRKPVIERAPAKSHHTHWPTVVAAVVLGIGMGLLGSGFFAPAGPGAADTIADATDEASDPAGQFDAADQADVVEADVQPTPVMNLEFTRSDSADDVWSIPVYDPGDLSDDYWNPENVIPPEVRSVFTREGYVVDHHREFYSVPLDDGRRVAVPVDTVQVRYAGL